jgi:ATP-dependent Lon protease
MTPQDKNRHDRKMGKKDKKSFKSQKRRGGGDTSSEDESLDSKGNIKGLIDYDYDSEDSFLTDDSYTETSAKSPVARRTRNALKNKKSGESKKQKKRVDTDDSEEDSDSLNMKIRKLKEETKRLKQKIQEQEEDVQVEKKKKKHRLQKYVVESSSEEETETEDESEEDSEDYDEEDGTVEEEEEYDEEDDEEYDDEEDEEDNKIIVSFGVDDPNDKLIPKRHNMKKESAEVKKFVKLITTPSDEDTIDGQIDQFKALSEEQRTKLINVLESKNKSPSAQQGLMFKILTMNLPTDIQCMVLGKYNSLQSLDPGTSEYFKQRNWLEKFTSIPLGIYKELPVKLSDGSETCSSFMEKARKCLDEAIYGQEESKLQILQFIGTKIANPNGRGLSLLLTGQPGVGKTSLIKNGVAKALQWPFQFISLGGDSDASTYTGHQLVYEGSHCGKIVNSLCAAKSMSLVMMFDEVDKISSTPKGEEVQNLLVHITDPVQNGDFEDKYLTGIPLDLSRVMFTFSANYLDRIDKVLLDRMNVVQLQGYNLKEKTAIAENYLLPSALKEVDLAEKIGISRECITHIIENYANEEVGVRELKRCIEQIAQKVNMLRMFNSKDLPFHIKDFTLPFVLKKEHVDLFLKKKEKNISALHMYA